MSGAKFLIVFLLGYGFGVLMAALDARASGR